jgi:hypothetical protein
MPACQKNKWKQSKIASDPDYKNDQRDYLKQWIEQHPGYYRNYRKQNPDYCDRNRELQKKRDKKRCLKQSCKRILDSLCRILVIRWPAMEMKNDKDKNTFSGLSAQDKMEI